MSAEPEPTIEDEEDQPSCQDGEKYVELESFKKLFKRPKYHKKEFARSISALYTYASKLETRKNDLPTEILSNDVETVWQFIAFRSKQISKEFRKRFGLFDIDLKLHKEAESSEDESEDQDENEDEELNENDEEEEEVDLLNLKDEDLKDLEREMDEMREEENEKEPEQDENTAPRKKYPKSVVDDKFFSLAEMNAFLDEQDRQEGAETDILDTADDSWTGTADYCYEDFFGKKDIAEEPIKGKEKKLKKRTRTKDSDKSAKKSKTVRFAMDEAEPEIEGEANGLMEEEEQTPVLLGDTEEPQQQETKLKRSLKRLKETIKKLEAENLAPRSWEMSGEVTAQQRGENELLETHLQFDHGIKKAPEITEVFTEKLEELIKQRIKDKVFDDVVRKKRIEERSEPYRNQAIEEREMVKTSLAEVYEKEYQKAVGENKANNEVNEEHAAIDKQMRELFRLIDALSNFDYTPPEVKPEVRVVSNMAALRVEEVGMSASTDAQLLAPEEMKKRQKGDLKGDDERDRTDKLRQRRKKKNRQRAMVELFGEAKAMEGLKKKKKKKVDEDTSSSGGEKLKSAAFFSKLQETVRNEIREKTTKKKKTSKVKSEQVSDGGSKGLAKTAVSALLVCVDSCNHRISLTALLPVRVGRVKNRTPFLDVNLFIYTYTGYNYLTGNDTMNYTGQYVQQPSGAMPPMPTQQQAQMMQQQRMVMGQPGQAAPGMRQMYPPPPGMMNSQVPGQPMYSHPSQMQQAQMMQQQQQQFQYYMSRFPPQWQQDIHMEQSQERKKHIFSQYVRKFNAMQQQQQSKMVSNGQGAMLHQPMMGSFPIFFLLK
ncbi:hypothetical protein NECAME_08446 [Necator americanus]|uniref:Uncharacterized protein n=1 Tax=Necator americanus TaxID=51031 RepID=W2THJ0_NECAM|nr:hypothetical protein NECAME_08446 [Necator americanus]ETN81535.1 hypothetical protein NECAME_08446 [Necator americanus]